MKHLITITIIFFSISLSASQLEVALQKLQQDITTTRHELMEQDKKQRAKKIALARDLAELRKDIKAISIINNKMKDDIEQAENRVADYQIEAENIQTIIKFLNNISKEFRRSMTTRMSSAEVNLYTKQFDEIDQLLGKDSSQEQLTAIPRLLELSCKQILRSSQNMIIPGNALDMSGEAHQGNYLQFGPISYFLADDNNHGGLIINRLGSTTSTIYIPKETPQIGESLQQLLKTGTAKLPLDSTLGSAIKLDRAKSTMIEHLKKGGMIAIPLFLLAAVALVLSIYKLLALQFLQTKNSENKINSILAMLANGKSDDAIQLASQLRTPLAPVIKEGIAHRHASKEQIEEIMYERILVQVPRLERFLTPIALCASTAPLLGLLGTVTGMIHTFKLITIFGTGDAGMLSSGISEALVTTELGLIVALPALLLHAYLSRKVKKSIAHTQQSAIMFVNGLKLKQEVID